MFGRDFWEERYRSIPAVWSGQPNPWLVNEVARLPAGRALDAGCGEGADAVWLAERDWRVTAVDISETAVRRGKVEADRRGLVDRIEWVAADLVESAPQPDSFDLVSSHFMHFEPPALRTFVGNLAAALAAGGTLLFVGHHVSDLQTTIARPPRPELLHTPEQIVALLPATVEPLLAEARARTAEDSEGRTVTIHDAVVVARRRPSGDSAD